MDQTDLIVNLVHLLKLKKFHILSHDYGDSVAQELMARYKYEIYIYGLIQ